MSLGGVNDDFPADADGGGDMGEEGYVKSLSSNLTAVDLSHLFLHKVGDAAYEGIGNNSLVDKLRGVAIVYLHLNTTDTHVGAHHIGHHYEDGQEENARNDECYFGRSFHFNG